MFNKPGITTIGRPLVTLIIASAIILAGCGGGKSNDLASPQADNTPDIRMDIPASLTGGPRTPQSKAKQVVGMAAANSSGTGEPCNYIGDDDDDHFRNGYKATKLLVSAIATWSCIGDLLIDVSNFVDHDGAIHAGDNDLSSPNYDPKDPTHYSVDDDSDSQTTVRLYYGYARNNPPQIGEDPQFYISWNQGADDELEGRIVVDARNINKEKRDTKDPILLRMDFHYTATEKMADMFLRFDTGNPWAEGFRIHLVKDMNANPLQLVYLARGLIKMKGQLKTVDNFPEFPEVHLYTVSNRAGKGAAIADIQDMWLPLKISGGIIDNHLGNYLISKNDTYFFAEDGGSDWINKTVPAAVYRGGRNTPETGGSWIPLDPSLDMIIEELGLEKDYFSGEKCFNIGDDCTQLITAVFDNSLKGTQEKNAGENPHDWRSDAIANPVYLDSVYPNGANWNGAFDFIFIPTT